MDWKAHMAIAAVCGAAAAYFFFPKEIALFTLVSASAGLLPDLDLRKSRGSRIVYAVAIVLALLVAYKASFAVERGWLEFLVCFAAIAAALAVADILLRPRHRGIMHSFAFLCLLSVACFLLFGVLAACAVLVGYFSHLILDNSVKLS